MADLKMSTAPPAPTGTPPDSAGNPAESAGSAAPAAPDTPPGGVPARSPAETRELVEAIEWLFFAYRDFTSDPDEILHEYGFGRAHHRVIHFVGRHPGITVADLLNILRITKQSLSRVLKELVGQGYIVQKTGTKDRRQRLLYLSDKGMEMERRLAGPQRERVAKALAAAGPEAQKAWCAVLAHLVNEDDRRAVEALISNGYVS
jgi:DNA-binding MarR family transcriptional regulator